MAELAAAVQSSESPGGDTGNILRPMFETKSYAPDTTFYKFLTKNTPEAEQDHLFFSTLEVYPKLRQSLPSINSARAFKYGSRAFGQKSWYSESFDIAKGLKTNADRQKLRYGLKSNVDFLIQVTLRI